MNIREYIFGPQLIGAIFFVLGLIMQRYPPKQINSFYGYRTSASMKNQQAWDEANRYAARLMTSLGLYSLIIGVAVTAAVNYRVSAPARESLMAAITIISAIVPAVVLITMTESHLKTFNKKNEIR